MGRLFSVAKRHRVNKQTVQNTIPGSDEKKRLTELITERNYLKLLKAWRYSLANADKLKSLSLKSGASQRCPFLQLMYVV